MCFALALIVCSVQDLYIALMPYGRRSDCQAVPWCSEVVLGAAGAIVGITEVVLGVMCSSSARGTVSEQISGVKKEPLVVQRTHT